MDMMDPGQVEWRYFTRVSGAQCVMITGMTGECIQQPQTAVTRFIGMLLI